MFLLRNDDTPVHLASSRPIDPNEFTAFMRAYQDMVFSTAVRLTANPAQAEDISQEVFLRAYESFENLRASQKAGGWLKTVATNLTLNHLTRHRKRWRLFSEIFSEDTREEEFEPAAAVFDTVLTELETDERSALVEQALARLPDHQRVPLVLYHYEEMPYQDLADRLGISLAKVKTDILRGRVAMAGLLAQSGVGAPSDRPRLPPNTRGAQS
ncbi:MAG TPA: sigma-70 family RNA polymerase sigma factor [Steroidobacteraceae bacterium]|nr:sigma-70 family RNA polymerase sigma factor [Steroidobacteraceae bacterium]